jgi:para-aminobenzoate synthetase/4-amino-4-deoxychorismate lyase
MRARVHTESLGGGPPPDDVVRLLSGTPGLACLWGDWAGGGALVLSRPLRVRRDDPVAALADQLALDRPDPAVVGGGWFGVLGYDAASSHLAFYDHLLRFADDEWHFEALWSDSRAAELRCIRDEARALLRERPPRPGWQAGTFDGPPTVAHLDAVEQAVEMIRAGDLYQVNVCTRLAAAFEGSAAALFADAAARLRPTYGAFVDAGAYSVASLSPELFLRRRADEITSSPIKGTVPRSSGAQALRRSTKDAAENVMIVDLMRNDLGRVAQTGSVHVAELLSVEPHPGGPAAGDVSARVGHRGAEGARHAGDRRSRRTPPRRLHRGDRVRQPVLGHGVQRGDPHVRDRRRPDRAGRGRRNHRRQRPDAGMARVPAQGGAFARCARRAHRPRAGDA